MSLERQCIYNPKPDGLITAQSINNDRGTHYNNDHYIKNEIYLYANNGRHVPYIFPIYIYDRGGVKTNGYYTIEDKKPREVVKYNTYMCRYRKYLKIHNLAEAENVDVSAKCIAIFHNDEYAKHPFKYMHGKNKGKCVPAAIEIQVMKIGERRHIFYVITEEGHIDAVLTKDKVQKRIHAFEYGKMKAYRNKLEKIKTEEKLILKRKREEGEKDEESLLLDNLPSINKRNVKIKFICSIPEEDLEREKEKEREILKQRERELLPILKVKFNTLSNAPVPLVIELGLFAQPQLDLLKRQALEISKNQSTSIIKNSAEIEIKRRIKKLKK